MQALRTSIVCPARRPTDLRGEDLDGAVDLPDGDLGQWRRRLELVTDELAGEGERGVVARAGQLPRGTVQSEVAAEVGADTGDGGQTPASSPDESVDGTEIEGVDRAVGEVGGGGDGVPCAGVGVQRHSTCWGGGRAGQDVVECR